MRTVSGSEWIVEAYGCAQSALRDLRLLEALFAAIVSDLGLNVVRESVWHQFPVTAGVTGLCLLAESHLTCHTFPEHGSLCLNLFCCSERADWPFERELKSRFGAAEVSVRRVQRPYTRCAPSVGETAFAAAEDSGR